MPNHPSHATIPVQRWTGVVDPHPGGGFVAVGDYFELVRAARAVLQGNLANIDRIPNVEVRVPTHLLVGLKLVLDRCPSAAAGAIL